MAMCQRHYCALYMAGNSLIHSDFLFPNKCKCLFVFLKQNRVRIQCKELEEF